MKIEQCVELLHRSSNRLMGLVVHRNRTRYWIRTWRNEVRLHMKLTLRLAWEAFREFWRSEIGR